VSLTPTPGCGVTAAVVLPPSLFADPELRPEELAEIDADVTVEVVPVALPASVAAAPAADPPAPPVAPAGPGWSRAERWIDLTDQPEPAGNGHGHGDGQPADPDADGGDWSGWWEPSPDDLEHGEPVSPLAPRPPLAERAQAPLSGRIPPPHPAGVQDHHPAGVRGPHPAGVPDPHSPGVPDPYSPGVPDPHSPGVPDPHPPVPGAPEREGSLPAAGVDAAVHSPRDHGPRGHDPVPPAPVGVEEGAGEPMLLTRRVPQAHLAPELRRNGRGAPAAEPEGRLPDAAEARAALSRYQASRQAARSVVDDGQSGPEGPAANGGWS
jgi:hypothetical protein